MVQAGDFVAYSGRAGRVRGTETVDPVGLCLAITLTAQARGVVFVPMARATDSVKPISEAVALIMDGNNQPAQSFAQNKMQRARAAKARKHAERMADLGRLGGLTKAKNRAA